MSIPEAKSFAIGPTTTPVGGGGKIAFASYRTGNAQIYTIDVSGKNETRLTNNTANDTEPVWSPDGRQIAFVSDRDGNRGIYIMNADGSNQHLITAKSNAGIMEPSWSPDGKHIAFASNRDNSLVDQIFVIDTDGNNLRQLTLPPHSNFDPVWSPDNKHIAFMSDRDGEVDIYVMNTDGTNVNRVTQTILHKFAIENENPNWSADGHYIIYDSFRSYRWEVYVTEIVGRTLRCVTCTNNTGGFAPIFSPDDKIIALTGGMRGVGTIYLINSNGTAIRRLTDDDQISSWKISWQPEPRN